MRVCNFRVVESPLLEGHARLVARLEYEGGDPAEELWFDVPGSAAAELSASGNPWLVALFPLAMVRREAIRIERPVDEKLLSNLRALGDVWRAWFPGLHRPRFECDVTSAVVSGPANPGTRRTGAFFSGGVDSFATALRNCARTLEPSQSPRCGHALDDLIYVWGFDLTLDQTDAFARTRAAMGEVAGAMGLALVVTATNLRHTLVGRAVSWGTLHHAAALAGVGLALEGRWARVLIASTLPYSGMFHLGSHPLTNVLFSSGQTRIINDSSDLNRVAKTELLSRSELAQRHLHVCWCSNSAANCCRCSKCYRTMAALDVLGVLDQFTTFDAKVYDRAKLGWVYAAPDSREFLREIAALALQRGRPEVARAMRDSIRRSVRADRVRGLLNRLKPYRGQGRLSNLAYRWFLGKMVE